MIKINLLGVSPPRGARLEGPSSPTSRLALIFICAMVIVLAIVGIFFKVWSGRVDQLKSQLAKEKVEQARLAGIRQENMRYQQQLAQLKRRKETIIQLDNSRTGPVHMMTALGNMVDRTSDLYLLSVTPVGNRLSIHGESNSVESIARFITVLKQSSAFGDVQLQQYYQDDQGSRLSYKFDLNCLYKPPSTSAATQATAPPGGRGQRATP